MPANKTVPTNADVRAFIDGVDNEQRRRDAYALLEIMRDETGLEPVMWGPSIIGFGSFHYQYASGHEGDFPLVGFSPRKANLVVYIMAGFSRYDDLLARLGKHKTGKSCLYLNKLEQVDEAVLREMICQSVEYVKNY